MKSKRKISVHIVNMENLFDSCDTKKNYVRETENP